MPARYPERIVCLTEETTETLYLLGEERRIVGISGYTVRPPRARREKPRVSAFLSAKNGKDPGAEARPGARLLRPAGRHRARPDQGRPERADLQPALGAGDPRHDPRARPRWSAPRRRARAGRAAGSRPRANPRERRSAFPQPTAGLLRGMGRADDQRHPLGERAGRDRRRRGRVLGAVAFAGAPRAASSPTSTLSDQEEPGGDPRLVVRQEVQARARRGAPRLGARSRRCKQDQLFEIKSADILQPGPGGAHRRRAPHSRAAALLRRRLVSRAGGSRTRSFRPAQQNSRLTFHCSMRHDLDAAAQHQPQSLPALDADQISMSSSDARAPTPGRRAARRPPRASRCNTCVDVLLLGDRPRRPPRRRSRACGW